MLLRWLKRVSSKHISVYMTNISVVALTGLFLRIRFFGSFFVRTQHRRRNQVNRNDE